MEAAEEEVERGAEREVEREVWEEEEGVEGAMGRDSCAFALALG